MVGESESLQPRIQLEPDKPHGIRIGEIIQHRRLDRINTRKTN
ncbi:hypothetical protein SDC9_137203 [bioreactor metagenome]|uniref:Uncharacterized protein n=1 Tax=bioreactor metagenome TaxID=1076179 RepID=A0A645DLC4_9ZZZZ